MRKRVVAVLALCALAAGAWIASTPADVPSLTLERVKQPGDAL